MSNPCNFSTLCNTVCSDGPSIQLFHCDRDTSSHLSLLQCSEKIPDRCMQFYDIPEAFLILYRTGIFSIDSSALKLNICASHREYFGIQWRRKQIRCIYQGHSEKSRSNADRGACPTLCKLYWLNTRQILPVGAGLCKKCATLLRKDVCNEQVNFENELEAFYEAKRLFGRPNSRIEQEHNQDVNSKDDQDMELAYSQSSVTDTFEGFSELSSQATTMSSQDWLETQMTTKDRFNAAMKMLSHSFEPLNCQLSKPWNTLSKSSRSYYLKKTQESIRLILNVIAPGQEDVLLDNLQQKEVSIDSTTRCIIDAFHNARNSRTQIQILSLIVNKFTKLELQKLIPGLSVAKIDGARKHSLVVGAGNLVNPPKIYRTKLTKPRVTHFIEFIMNPLYSTIIGFGQTMLKLSTNEKMEIPRVIRNVINARIISNYQNYCEENNLESYSRPTLYRILKVCAASKQKALQGLDNTTSGGMGAIDTLLKLVTKLETFGISHESVEKLKDSLHVINQFLKFEYKLHLNKLDGCTDHCTTYALSDPSIPGFASSCEHQHDANCDKCSLVDNVLDLITTELSKVQVNESVQDDIDFDLNSATKNLLEWKRHLLRTVHQDAARNDILKNLTPNQSLIIMDWAMKFLPVQFRETQSEFFGKKGLSWHISCSVTRSASSDELDLNCYIHILENGTQGWFSIANILLHLLEQLKCKNQSLEEIYLKSDNAACYHCVNLLSFIQQNNSTFPIRIKEYNFSEAQSGKDLCDSKTGSSRLHIYRYANEGHNVLNAGDMKKALESYGGVKGTNVCVVSIDQASEPKIKSKIPGISVLNNFAFTEIGIVARKAYQVGSGQLIQTSGISDQNLSTERVFNLEVHEPFTGIQTAGKVSYSKTAQHTHDTANEPSAISEDETTYASDNQNVNFFCCPDISCNKTFARATNLEKHILVGNHSYRTNKSGLDTAVEVYASISESVQDTQINLIQTVSAATQSNATSNMINKGWALKGKRTNIRFSPKVKSYLNEICFNCEKTGKRPNYFALSDELRKSCDENGERLFKMEEWLNPTQIKGYFATLVTKLKSGTISSNSITDNSAVVQSIELREIEENVEQDEKLYEAVAIIDANTYNENVENFVDEVYTAVNM